VTDAEVVVRLSGWTAAAALERDLRIPPAAITAVSTDRYADDELRSGGTSIPFTDLRAGRFHRRGRRTFLSFEGRDRAVTLDLDRARSRLWCLGCDRVALVDDPTAVGSAIEARLPR
jgi:hypothetical protein